MSAFGRRPTCCGAEVIGPSGAVPRFDAVADRCSYVLSRGLDTSCRPRFRVGGTVRWLGLRTRRGRAGGAGLEAVVVKRHRTGVGRQWRGGEGLGGWGAVLGEVEGVGAEARWSPDGDWMGTLVGVPAPRWETALGCGGGCRRWREGGG